MRPTILLLLVALATSSACKRDDGMSAGTATVRSGTPSGVRVTSAPAEDAADPAARVAAAICTHERLCGHARGDRGSEALLQQEEHCVAEVTSTTTLALGDLPCTNPAASTGIGACVAAIKQQSCDGRSSHPSILPECRPVEICRRGGASP
jgi:hypothetical protein